jgi:hypothetical protein
VQLLGISLGAIEQSFKEDSTAGRDALKESLDRGSKMMFRSDAPVETSGTATGATPGETVVVVTGAAIVVVVVDPEGSFGAVVTVELPSPID